MSHKEMPHRRRVSHLERRDTGSAPRRRETDSNIRRRKEDHKKANTGFGAFVTVAIAVLFLAYVFNFQNFATVADRFFSGLDAAGKSENDAVVSFATTAFPLLGLLIGALILFALIRWVLSGAKKSRKKRALAGRETISLDHFREIASARGIRPRIATHAYTLLLPHYHRHMRVRLDDRLHEDLHLSDNQITDMLGNLLRNTDRKLRVGAPTVVVTVMDLLQTVQDAPRTFLHETGIHPVADTHGRSVIRPTIGKSPSKPPVVPVTPAQ